MNDRSLSVEMARLAGERERRTHTWHGLAVRCERIANDGRSLICSVFQHRRLPLTKPMDSVEMVLKAEWVLQPLIGAGLVPMVTAIEWDHAEELRDSYDKPDPHDPVGLLSALRAAGMPYPRLQNTKQEEPLNEAMIEIPFWRRALGMFAP